MAKGNMFQGMARGKVGDVVFSRLNGEQISRVRNRHPRNPRTEAQLYQRAIMATVMQAYSAGKEIFDHSFQGKAVGGDNQREFLSRNMTILRNILKVDIDGELTRAQSTGRVVAPKSSTPVPFAGMLVSKGQLENNFITLSDDGTAWSLNGATDSVGKTAAQFFASHGLTDGDIFTFVVFRNTENIVYTNDNIPEAAYKSQYGCQFGWLRLIVKTTLDGNIGASTKFSDVFDIETDGVMFDVTKAGNIQLGSAVDQTVDSLFAVENENTKGTIAVIQSRRDLDVRSTTYMQQIGGPNATAYGIATPDILTVWTKEIDSLGGSQLILEGGDENFQ